MPPGFEPADLKELRVANALMAAHQLSLDPYVNSPVVWDMLKNVREWKERTLRKKENS